MLDEIKDYIDRFLSETIIQYHITRQDTWIKFLYEKVQEQEKEIERLEKQLENTVFTDTDIKPKPHATFEID